MARKPNSPRDKSMKVQQHFAAGNSAAEIMAKHIKGPNRMLPPGSPNPNPALKPRFEFVGSKSYHEMCNTVADIRNKFLALPARLRTRFSNDPLQMLRFIEDPKNRMDSVRLGLVPPTDEEYTLLSKEAEDKRLETLRKALAPSEAPHLPDPEAQPDYGRKAPPRAKNPPPERGERGGSSTFPLSM